MIVGFQTFTPDGSIQLDAALVTFGLRHKLTKADFTFVGPASYVKTITAVNPVIAVRQFDGTWVRSAVPNGNGTVTITMQAFGATNADFTLYVFDTISDILPNGSMHGVGLELFNTAGVCTYSSTLLPIRIAKISQLPTQSTTGEADPYGGTSGTNGVNVGGSFAPEWDIALPSKTRVYAAILPFLRFGLQSATVEYYFSDDVVELAQFSTDNTKCSIIGRMGGGSSDWGGWVGTKYYSKLSPQAIIIDVTNY